jgi:hypothetical protein
MPASVNSGLLVASSPRRNNYTEKHWLPFWRPHNRHPLFIAEQQIYRPIELRLETPISLGVCETASLRPSGLVWPQPMRTGSHDHAPVFVFRFPVISLQEVVRDGA